MTLRAVTGNTVGEKNAGYAGSGVRGQPPSDPRTLAPSHPSETIREGGAVMTKKIWFITGAGRGMGLDFARAVLAAGHAVVATGRDSGRVSEAVGESENVLAVKLD